MQAILGLVFLAACFAPPIEGQITSSCLNNNFKNNNCDAEYSYSSYDGDDVEKPLAYFREDMCLNIQHFSFHVAFPYDWTNRTDYFFDRQGEFFYYWHHHLLARYNTERLAANLKITLPFGDYVGQSILEPYDPAFNKSLVNNAYVLRPTGTYIKDIPEFVTLDAMRLWIYRIKYTLATRQLSTKTRDVVILNRQELISNISYIIESSLASAFPDYYGSVHNVGHTLIGTTPVVGIGAMYRLTMSCRDPIFFRWHTFIDNLFVTFKDTFRPYTFQELRFPNVRLMDLSVTDVNTNEINKLNTYMQRYAFVLRQGLDFIGNGGFTYKVTYPRLQHNEFNYNLIVQNSASVSQAAVVRIFLAPVIGERKSTLTFAQQRRLFIELDKFTVVLKRGNNTISRSSTLSSVTLDPEASIRMLQCQPDSSLWTVPMGYDYCGLPHHLLLPKGTKGGTPYVLFAMVGDWAKDKVSDARTILGKKSSVCGNYNTLYADKRMLGFPFDRPFEHGTNLYTFLLPNMAVTNVTITHDPDRYSTEPVVEYSDCPQEDYTNNEDDISFFL